MALLDECLSKNVRLLDYECVRADGDSTKPRLIAFGNFAGKSGMVNGFSGIGGRLLSLGYSTPFLEVSPTYTYGSYTAASDKLLNVGQQIRKWGLPVEHAPFVVGVAGGGNVSSGVRDAIDQVNYISPSEPKPLLVQPNSTRPYPSSTPNSTPIQLSSTQPNLTPFHTAVGHRRCQVGRTVRAGGTVGAPWHGWASPPPRLRLPHPYGLHGTAEGCWRRVSEFRRESLLCEP